MSDIIYLDHLDINHNQLKNALAHPLAAAPSSPVEGQLYWNTTTKAFGIWTGTQWNYGVAALNLLPVPAGNVDMVNYRLVNLGDPVNPQDAATMTWVQAQLAGIRTTRDACRIKSTGALPAYTRVSNVLTANANGAFPAIDGVTLTAADAIPPDFLFTDGASGVDNGIYTLTQTGSGGTPWKLTRRTDADTSAEMKSGTYLWINEGTAFADTGWLLITNDPIVLNTTALTFTQVSGLGQVTAGTGLTKTGSTLNVGQGTGIIVNADDVAVDPTYVTRKASATIGDNATLNFDVVHNFGIRQVTVAVYATASPYQEVFVTVKHKDTNTVTVEFAVAPTTGQYMVVVHG